MSKPGEYFSCSSCGKRFRWNPQRAGKQGKCSCGQIVSVPITAPFDEDEGVYAIVNEEPAAVVPIGQAPPLAAPAPAALAYQTPLPAQNPPLHLVTDIVLPLVALLIAFLFISLNVSSLPRFRLILISLWILILATAAPGIALFMLYGVISFRRLRIPFGSFALAAFKILSVVIFTDAVFFGLLRATGPRYTVRSLFFLLMLALGSIGATVKIVSLLFFHREGDHFKTAAFPVSGLVWILQLLLNVMLYSMLANFAIKRSTPPAALTAAASAPAAPGSTPITAADREIMRAVSQGLLVMEARQWKSMRLTKRPELDQLIDDLYSAGASKVYVDMRIGGLVHPEFLDVQLPANPTTQAQCLAVYTTYANAHGLSPMGPGSTSHMFTRFRLAP